MNQLLCLRAIALFLLWRRRQRRNKLLTPNGALARRSKKIRRKNTLTPALIPPMQDLCETYALSNTVYLKKRKKAVERAIKESERAVFTSIEMIDPNSLPHFTRMSSSQFEILLSLVKDKLKKKTTQFRQPIPAELRLVICLRYLATGAPYPELASIYHVGISTVHGIVKETCQVLVDVLKPLYLAMPNSASEWQDLAVEYEKKWNFPHCVGSLSGVQIKVHSCMGSEDCQRILVLMAASDASYCFTYVDVGNYEKASELKIFENTHLALRLNYDPDFLPADACLPLSTKVAPYIFVADEEFPLGTHLLKSFPGQCDKRKMTYNYRLSKAKKCVENALGILSSRWKILRTTMTLSPENATSVTLACCCLHNFLMKIEKPSADRTYCPTSFADCALENGTINEGSWRTDGMLKSIPKQGPNKTSNEAVCVREVFTDYFNEEGAVPWLDNLFSLIDSST